MNLLIPAPARPVREASRTSTTRVHSCTTPLIGQGADGSPMDTAIKSLIAALGGLLALSGAAAAQTGCPECDEDGEASADNSYHDLDAGVVGENETVLADSDAAVDDKQADGGFFAWLSLCLHAFVKAVEDAVGMDTGVDGNAEAYVSEDGVDVDVTVRAAGEVVDFDDSPVGDADGMTWEAMGDVSADVREATADRPELPHADDTTTDLCVDVDALVVACG